MGDLDIPIVEGQTLNLKESIILSIFQYAWAFQNQIANYAELVERKYLYKAHPQISKFWPQLESTLAVSERAFKKKIIEAPTVIFSPTEK